MGTKISALTETTAPIITDVLPIVTGGGTQKVQVDNLIPALFADTTVSFTATESTAEIQAKIDAVPKNLNGYTLTFQFADGTYNLNAQLTFDGFFGGEVQILGNASESTALHTTQAVIINTGFRFQVSNCSNVVVHNLRLNSTVGSSGQAFVFDKVLYAEVKGCYVNLSTTTGNVGLWTKGSTVEVHTTYFSGSEWALFSEYAGYIVSINNASIGTLPKNGLVATHGGVVAKDGTQPSGSVANEFSGTGGVIR